MARNTCLFWSASWLRPLMSSNQTVASPPGRTVRVEISILQACINSLMHGRCRNFNTLIWKHIMQSISFGTRREIALMRMPQRLTNEKSTSLLVLAWCFQATSHYLTNIDLDLCRHMPFLGHNYFKNRQSLWCQECSYAMHVGNIVVNYVNCNQWLA